MASLPTQDPVRVLVVSDVPLLAMGVQATLAALPEVAATVRRPEELLQRDVLAEDNPELVVMACWQHQPLACQRLFPCHSAQVLAPVMCLATEEGSCRYGFTDSVLPLSRMEPAELRCRLREALGLSKRPEPGQAGNGHGRVSAREREIGLLVAAGFSSQEIGKMLFISPRTVEKHRANLMDKLGVANAAALTRELIFMSWADQGALAAAGPQLQPVAPAAPEPRFYQAQAS